MKSTATQPSLALSTFQRRVMTTPESCDLLLDGGRGGGKSYALAMLFLRHAEQYDGRARMLFARRNFPGIVDFEVTCREVFGTVYGRAASYNAASHIWRFPNGATLQLDQLESHQDFQKYQGKSYTLIAVDEAGQYPDPAVLDLLRSCLRAPAPITPRMVLAVNPGGPGHGWIVRRHVFAARPWQVYVEKKSGRQFINCPSTYRDNEHLDQGSYAAQLAAACATDPELLKAWDGGDWTIARGAYFSAVLDQSRVLVESWPNDFARKSERGWKLFISHDFGVSAPSVTFVCAKSLGTSGPDGRWYSKDSIVLLDELATHEPGTIERGMGYTVPVLAEQIVEMTERWGLRRAEGFADDAIFARTGSSAGAIRDEFARCDVFFEPAQKGARIAGWEKMRRMLADAGKPDVPGLFVSRNCKYFWETVPVLARDPRRPDDVDSRGPDHAADAARYATTPDASRGEFSFGRVRGLH